MKLVELLKKNLVLLILFFVNVSFFAINLRINVFSYNNFDFGKFDLGNMVQMLWNTQHGRFMYLTDYFGTNLPRWAMSHVDPILLLFLPLFAVFPHALTLVLAQVALVLFSSFLLYAISMLQLKSKISSLFIALAYISYPAIGYLTAKTGFHGVTSAIPFFLGAFYVYEKMYLSNTFTKKGLVTFWILLVIALTGKEQISAYVFLYGLFLYFFRSDLKGFGSLQSKSAIAVTLVGALWFFTGFFIIIPRYAWYRVQGYERFAQSMGIEGKEVRDAGLDNYFLSRYEAFGDTYTEVIKNMILNPELSIKIFFGGDKLENFKMTFAPVLYLPFAAPAIFAMAGPDLLMNYLTSQGGIGTSEIQNHRISMIIPVLFVAVIFSIRYLYIVLGLLFRNHFRVTAHFPILVSFAVFFACVYTSFKYENPVFMWAKGAIQKRLPVLVAQAKTGTDLANNKNLSIGDVVKISPLENKDRECALKVVNLIPNGVSVSGPDYLGAHLAKRETYAIFPALYNQADFVIVDIFSKKLLTILDIDTGLTKEIINKVLRNPDYKLETSCGNLFVFKKVGTHEKSTYLPIQERYSYSAKYDYTIYSGLTVVDYTMPAELVRAKPAVLRFVYLKKDVLDNFFLFLTFVNEKTGEMYQTANLPSFAINPLQSWKEDYYYLEDVEVALPTYLDQGYYRVFVGMTNYVKTRSIYLGDIQVK